MKRLLLVLLTIGLICPLIAQDREQLDEVVVRAVNYKYLSAIDNSKAPVPIRILQKEVAMYNVTDTDYYIDEYETYNVTFYIPNGRIVAAYDEDGNIIRTIERFKNFQLPEDVRASIDSRYPGWEILKDVYLVNYSPEDGAEKAYKVKLKKGKEVMRVKLDARGNYL
jgi:hypothetical protein